MPSIKTKQKAKKCTQQPISHINCFPSGSFISPFFRSLRLQNCLFVMAIFCYFVCVCVCLFYFWFLNSTDLVKWSRRKIKTSEWNEKEISVRFTFFDLAFLSLSQRISNVEFDLNKVKWHIQQTHTNERNPVDNVAWNRKRKGRRNLFFTLRTEYIPNCHQTHS